MNRIEWDDNPCPLCGYHPAWHYYTVRADYGTDRDAHQCELRQYKEFRKRFPDTKRPQIVQRNQNPERAEREYSGYIGFIGSTIVLRNDFEH